MATIVGRNLGYLNASTIENATMRGLFRLKFISISIVFLFASCNIDKISKSCNNLPFYCSLEINGEVACYGKCFAMLTNTSTKTSLSILAGNTTDSEKGLILVNNTTADSITVENGKFTASIMK